MDLLLAATVSLALVMSLASQVRSDEANDASGARGYDLRTSDVYQPVKKPGYACWVCLWETPSGELMMEFTEKRRARNTSYRPVPLEFWESMALPIKYHGSFCNGDPGILTQGVVLKSADSGLTWVETGRSETGRTANCYAHTSLKDGSLLRLVENSYTCFTSEDKPSIEVQRSRDGGKRWSKLAVLLEGDYASCAYRVRQLRDGTIAALNIYGEGFGPGRTKSQRLEEQPNVLQERQVGLWFSRDDGRKWTGPLIVLPGVFADEPDFVELPSGDLLLLNSSVQDGPQMRQYVRLTSTGFIPGPVMKVVSGVAPETFCVGKDGLLVGTTRCSAYTCSNDEGATWHTISGLPNSYYQPQIVALKDGRYVCAWHRSEEGPGGDHFVGQDHQFVGQHVFRVDASDLPATTRLSLSRDMNEEHTRFINAFTATLRSGNKPVPGRPVRFRVHKCYPFVPSDTPDDVMRTTDKDGGACLLVRDVLEEIDETVDIFRDCYYIQAFFDAQPQDQLAKAESPRLRIYPMSAEKNKAYSYSLFTFEGRVFVSPETAVRFPEIDVLVRSLRRSKEFTLAHTEEATGLSGTRLAELLDLLVASHLLRRLESGGFGWRVDLYADGGVRVLEIEDRFE